MGIVILVAAGALILALALKRSPIRADPNRTAGSAPAPTPPLAIAGPPLPAPPPPGGTPGVLSSDSASLSAPLATIRPAAEPANIVNLQLSGPVHTDTTVKAYDATPKAPYTAPDVGLTAGPVYQGSDPSAGTILYKAIVGSK